MYKKCTTPGSKMDLASCPIRFLFSDVNDEASQKEKLLD